MKNNYSPSHSQTPTRKNEAVNVPSVPEFPDPAGVASVDPSNPQTWNRYAYALNSPLNFVDPSGLYQGGIPYDPAPLPFDSFTYIGIPVFGVTPYQNFVLGTRPVSSSPDLQGEFGIPFIGDGLSLGPFGQPQNPQNPTPPNPTPPNPNNQQLKPQAPTPNPNNQQPPANSQPPPTNTCDRMENVGNGFMAGGAVLFGAGSLADLGIITAPLGAGLQGAGTVMAAGGGLAYLGGMACNLIFH